MPSPETVLVDDIHTSESNDTTNISEEEDDDDDTVYIDLTKEDTEQSICITLIHVPERGLTDERFEEYKCILDANDWSAFRSLHCELTTWDTRDDLEFKFPDGEVLTNGETTTSKTPSELNMKDGDDIYAEGTIVSREDISVNFINEDGEVITLCANLRHGMHRLFEQYSAKKKMSLLLGRMIFHYSKPDGVPISTQCQSSLAYMEISSGDIIYVVRRLPPPEDLDSITITEDIVYYLVPESLVGQRILMNECKSQGIIIDALQHNISGTVWVWVVEYADGRTCQHTIEDITEGMQCHYNNGGVGVDLLHYISLTFANYRTDLESLIKEMKQLNNHGIGDEDKVVLGFFKLEQEMRRALDFDMDIELWTEDHPLRNKYGKAMHESLENLLAAVKELPLNKKKVSKPIVEAGELVVANSSLIGGWCQGIVKSYKEFEDIDGYGPRRTYSILFENGDYSNDVKDYSVIKDYSDIPNERNEMSTDSKGVQHIFDKESTDPWAREVGWYVVTTHDELKYRFTGLPHACRAHDANTVFHKGLDNISVSDLNIPWDWSGYLAWRSDGDNKENFYMVRSALKEQIPLSVCLFASYERIKDPFMKRLWKALIMSSQPNSIIVGELDPRRCWKEAYGHYLDCNLAQLKDSLYIFALRHICFENVSPIIFFMSFCGRCISD